MIQKLTMRNADVNLFLRLWIQLDVAPEGLRRDENLSPFQILSMSLDLNEPVVLVQKKLTLLTEQREKISVALLRWNVDKPEYSFAHVRLSAGKREDEKFQEKISLIYKPEKFIFLSITEASCKNFQEKWNFSHLELFFSIQFKMSGNFWDKKTLFLN